MPAGSHDDHGDRVPAGPIPLPAQREAKAPMRGADTVEAQQFPGYVVVTATGEFDVYSAPDLREVLAAYVDVPDCGLVVDLTGVTFLDSSALGVLVGALKRSRSNGSWLRLVCPNERIVKIFEITGLIGVFEIWTTIDDATRQTG